MVIYQLPRRLMGKLVEDQLPRFPIGTDPVARALAPSTLVPLWVERRERDVEKKPDAIKRENGEERAVVANLLSINIRINS